ncbi:hypothetical protein MIND_00982000 [Mycena indigotica]|uniref:Uncharacterized protein n=1 Tax=Mycena indigotica TaxID=2126181 RepID=A0A8H6VXI0_9AGAR|nr:uncharacterized protein MIND_00982000 [Mycena indigotica]KAF7297482.1 hypothetical protein MIND_00982000 [Mycena indigotica]
MGIRADDAGNNTHYVPCFRHNGQSYSPYDLPLRTHDEFIDDAVAVESAPTNAEAERQAKETGINGLPILATLSSLEFPHSFGHDLMHLIPENVIKNLLLHWIGEYKKLDEGDEEYELAPAVIEEIGRECVAAGDTTPAAFGARVPNIDTQRFYFTAESYTLWTTLLAPVLLRNRFRQDKYYRHFRDLVEIFNDCLSMKISREYIDVDLRDKIATWVFEYERYYYQYEDSRLSACPLTIHALLHIPDDILNGGPMWTYWNYVTERYVGFIVRSSKSRRNPYASFARRLREIAQNSAIKVRYHLSRELDLSPKREEELKGHRVDGQRYSDIRVLYPRAVGPLSTGVAKAINHYLQNTYRIPPAMAKALVPEEATHWGRVSFLGGGDKMRGADLTQQSGGYMTRDASFVKFSHLVDTNARNSRQPRVDERQVAYGQLLRLIEFSVDLPKECQVDHPLLLAVVRPVKPPKDNPYPFPVYQDGKFGSVEVVDADDVSCLVARVIASRRGPRFYALIERPDAMGASPEEE